MRTFSAISAAQPEAAWELLSRPAEWHAWAPHLRGAWGLGEPEVEFGRTGAARLLGVVPVPARIVGKREQREWTWSVPPGVTMVHRVEPHPDGSEVSILLRAPEPLESILAAAYGPVIRATLMRLAARA